MECNQETAIQAALWQRGFFANLNRFGTGGLFCRSVRDPDLLAHQESVRIYVRVGVFHLLQGDLHTFLPILLYYHRKLVFAFDLVPIALLRLALLGFFGLLFSGRSVLSIRRRYCRKRGLRQFFQRVENAPVVRFALLVLSLIHISEPTRLLSI